MDTTRLIPLLCLLPALLAAPAMADAPVLDEGACWRRHYQFGPSRYTPAVLRDEGTKLLGPGLDKLRQRTEKWMQQQGLDPAKNDWRDYASPDNRAGPRSFPPTPAPAPPAGWAAPEFDDSAWVRQRGPFQGARQAQTGDPILGQYDESVDLRLQAACYRTRFVVDDPAKAGDLTLRLTYCGGARIFLNGREVARGHLPPGDLAPDAQAEPYAAQAYAREGETIRARTIGPVPVRPDLLRPGTNVLAVEIRASPMHPVVEKNPTQPNWGGPTRPWPHARLCQLTLRTAGSGVSSALARPSGVQVWAEDMHHRVQTDDFLAPGEPPGTVRLAAPRNGLCSAQVVIGTTRELAGVRVEPSELARDGGPDRLPAAAVEVLSMLPFPAAEWSLQHLGDERGLGASFPGMARLRALAEGSDGAGPCLFDQLTRLPPVRVPANTARPFWLSVRVPKTAPAGRYRGAVVVRAPGAPAVSIPVELEVAAWTLPDPRQFQTIVGCEQNPYGVARQFDVPAWSDRHFEFLARSFEQLGRAGNCWLNVPVLARTEYGNRDDSMVRWVRGPDGRLTFDFRAFDRYLDVATQHAGAPRFVVFVVAQGMKSPLTPPTPPQVPVLDERTGRSTLEAVPCSDPAAREAWQAFGAAVVRHLRERGLEKALHWGSPLEAEADPELKNVLEAAAPGVGWTASPHEMMWNGTYAKNEKFYRVVADIRYQGGWASFRDDEGWRSRTVHLLNPRVGGTAFALHTTSSPFAYRCLPERALSRGRNGFTRVGADEWAAVHYDGMSVARWQTGVPVLFLLWPGKDGAEPSARFEALIEGVQETEARIFLEQALGRSRLSPALADRLRALLAARVAETSFFLGNSVIYGMEEYHHRWQERARLVYQAAADAAREDGGGRP